MKNENHAHSGKKDSLLHIVVGFVILAHGIERIDKHFYSGIIFILAGIVFLALALFHKKLIQRFRFIDSIFLCLEGLLAIVVAVELFQEQKKFIPFFYLVGALFYFFAGLKQYKRLKVHTVEAPPEVVPLEEPANV